MTQALSSGRRKYTAILEQLVTQAICRVEVKLVEFKTITDGVKKEKVKWVRKNTWPKGQALKIDIDEIKNNPDKAGMGIVTFKRVLDTSINNL